MKLLFPQTLLKKQLYQYPGTCAAYLRILLKGSCG